MRKQEFMNLMTETFKGIKELKDGAIELREGIKELKDFQAKTDAQLAKTDAQLAKTDAQLADTDKLVKRVAKMVGGISNNQGDVAEEFFYNTLSNNQSLAGIKYDFVGKNWQHDLGIVRDEFDIVMVNGKDVAIIEVKYKAHEKDLEKLTTRKIENFKKLYPIYNEFNHHLGLATFHISEDLKDRALDEGVIVLQRRGEIIETFSKQEEPTPLN